jgi:hypothetical protein
MTLGLHINRCDETIRLGPLGVRFLIAGENSSGSIVAFCSAQHSKRVIFQECLRALSGFRRGQNN